MFAPIGYTTLSGLYEDCLDTLLPKALETAKKMCAAAPTRSAMIAYFETISPADWVEHQLFSTIQDNLFICSPSGQILKLDQRSISSNTDNASFSWVDLKAACERRTDDTSIPDKFEHMFSMNSYPMSEFLDEFERHTSAPGQEGDTPWDLVEKNGNILTHHSLPLYYERKHFTITTEAFSFIEKLDFIEADEFRDTARILQRFEGWSMCLENSFSEGTELREKIFLQPFERPKDSTHASKGGRPRHARNRLKNGYMKIFPNGHGSKSLYEVLRAVSEITGEVGSIYTMRRAVDEIRASRNSSNNRT
ncbi:hypothetical protein [Phaeobacter inhibens]|uniref:hypothetical protein n=1 Tax=Phaeobacter inhibens TaxID=221822 RepID=UPI000CA18ACB|nr:hypothetical protein [Phaeobacter inhibens]AUQ53197.1 hypothetical protein PhaeoP92_00491 [Phaeobacter inhibens]AUQ77213.1 hypothetical protein PhaeoP74_00492 [Phaeobacter inhibens]AUR14372.1 hypothetical protein PhaeoP70_00490 [Phaeobacter inhibens]